MLNRSVIDRFVVPGKGIAKRGIFMSRRGLEFLGNTKSQRSGLILQYHSVNPPGQNKHVSYVHPSLSVSIDVFDRQLAFIDRHFKVVTLEKLLAYVNGDCRISGQPVAITFDDGYQDNYLYAFPQLLKYGLPAMFYLTTDCIDANRPLWTSELRYIILRSPKSFLSLTSLPDAFPMKTVEERSIAIQKLKSKIVVMERREREEFLTEIRKEAGISAEEVSALGEVMLTWEDVKLMKHYGMQFGAHTLSHPSLPNIPKHEAWREIFNSKWVLEDRLSEEIRHFSYPNPGDVRHSSPEIANMLKDAGFSSATTSLPGRVVEGDEVFQLKRKGIYALFNTLPDFYFWIQKETLADIGHRLNQPIRWNRGKKRSLNEKVQIEKTYGAGLTCTND